MKLRQPREIQMNSLYKASRKIGLGFKGNTAPDMSVDDWIDDQLSAEFKSISLKNQKSTPYEYTEWPAENTYSLDNRINAHIVFSNELHAIRDRNLDDVELGNALEKLNRDFSTYYVDDTYKFAHAGTYGDDQLNQRLTHFWLNHFTVGNIIDNENMIGHFVDEAINAKLHGSFADLLYGVITHPAMLSYLDNIYNVGEDSQRARDCRNSNGGCFAGLNDNLGREMLELHTVSSDDNYTEDDIRGAAKILAGWGYSFPDGENDGIQTEDFWHAYVESRAEPGTKQVMGVEFPAGAGALRQLTDMLAQKQATRKFISTKLARHFIGESASTQDISVIEQAWEQSNGDLLTIHRAALKRAVLSDGKKFLWPMTWFFQALRMSGATVFRGHEESEFGFAGDPPLREPHIIFEEMGQNFWSNRQPNGFSDFREDWVSTEHFDRRIRFAELIWRAGKPTISIPQIIENYGFSDATKRLIDSAENDKDKFILLLCCPEFLEV